MSKIEKMSFAEMQQMQMELSSKMEEMRDDVKKSLLEKWEAEAEENGMTVAEVVGNSKPETAKKERKKVEPKYAHPENPELTWTGRGRKPIWISEALENGQEIEEFLIEKQE